MRSDQRVSYAERIERVVSFLEREAGRGTLPSLAELADVAAMSPYHFHRVFRVMTGETVGEAITRIRLARSLPELGAGSIGHAAGSSGYATTQAYGRALRAQAGATPSELRDDEERRARVQALLSRPRPAPGGGATPLSIEVQSLAPLRLITVRAVGDYRELNLGYHRLFELVCAQVGPEAIEGIYGVPHDDPRTVAAAECRFDCGFALGVPIEARGGMTALVIVGGRHAGMHHLGDYDLIHAEIDRLYAWAIDREEAIAPRPLFIHYFDDPDEVSPEAQRAMVWLPLEDNAS